MTAPSPSGAAIPRPIKKPATSTVPPRKVAVVTHYFAGHGGGIETVAGRLIRELGTRGELSFTWVASDCDPSPAIDKQTMQPMRCCNALEKLLGLPLPLWGIGSLRTMIQTVRQADILWLHDTLYFGNIIAFIAARRMNKPIMITQHIAPIPYRNPLVRWLMRTADRLVTARMLRLAQEVTFISDRVAEDYYRRVAFTRPIKIIPNGVDVRVFHAAIPENRRFLRQQFALKEDQPVLLFVGRFVEKKGLDVIRRLAAQFPEWRFWLAGGGPIKPTDWLLPNIHVFEGRKSQSLAELYQAADLLLMPSYGEGFPLVVQEAMACGLPVLCAPETAKGYEPAIPHLHLADVWPDNAERTAAVWAEKLQSLKARLPMAAADETIAEFALLSWDWPPIARAYGNLLHKM